MERDTLAQSTFEFNEEEDKEFTDKIKEALKQTANLSRNSGIKQGYQEAKDKLMATSLMKEAKQEGIKLGEEKVSKDLLKHTSDNINENIRQAKQELWDDLQNKALTDKEWFKIKKRHKLK